AGALSNLKTISMFVAIIEDQIVIADPKLDITKILTGETHFNFVMKAMLPSAAGITMADMVIGANTSIKNLVWRPDPTRVYSNKFRVVAFVQNTATKEIYQTAVSPVINISNSHNITAVADHDTSIRIYPNPANREFNLTRSTRADHDSRVQIVNQLGVVVVDTVLKKEDL